MLVRASVAILAVVLSLSGCECESGATDTDAAATVDASGSCTPVEWTVAAVDAEPASDAVLVLDESGRVHFAYITADAEVRYASGAPGAWESETLQGEAGMDATVDVAVDASSRVHVAFRETRAGDPILVHGLREAGGGWTMSDVERLGGDPSLVVDADGVAHLAILYTSGWELHYGRRRADGSWTVTTLDVESPQRFPAIALDPDGALHLAYAADGQLHHAPAFTEAWAPTVVGPVWSAAKASLEIDASGGVHVTRHAASPMFPAVTHDYLEPGGEWVSTRLDPDDEAVFFLGDLALDPAGDAHAFYTRMEPGVGVPTLHYGHRPAGGEWTTEELVEDAPWGTRSVAADAEGGVHVALFGRRGVHYGYTRRCPP